MTLKEAIRVLVRGDGSRMSVIDRQGLRTLFRGDNDPAFNNGIRALVACGLLERIAYGVYCNHGASLAGLWEVGEVVRYLRPGHLCYLSYEFALAHVGSIGQVPFVFTVATTGKDGRYGTPFGNVEFTRNDRNAAEVLDRTVYDSTRQMLFAHPDMALEDLRCARKAAAEHLVDPDDHAEIVAEWAA